MRKWYRDELVPLLERTGFAAVDVRTGADEQDTRLRRLPARSKPQLLRGELRYA